MAHAHVVVCEGQEWRHAHGMRCLRIPNTKHFHDITHIEDAMALVGL